jgi:hypothetical protein
MQYPFLSFLEVISLFITLCLAAVIFYFSVRKKKEIKFLTATKAFVLYELASFVVYLFYPKNWFHYIFNYRILLILDLIIYGLILFAIFYFINRKLLLINWKKSLVLFALLVLVVFPVLSYCRQTFELQIMKLPPFANESAKLDAEISKIGLGGFVQRAFDNNLPGPAVSKVTNIIEKATLDWSSDRIRTMALTF